MDPLKDFKRTTIPFGKPVPIPLDTSETLQNNFGKVRAVVDHGVVTIQTKKLKDNSREVARFNLNVTPITIEFAIEEATAP